MKNTIFFPLEKLSENRALSERSLAEQTGVSRSCIRQIKEMKHNVTLSSLDSIAEFFGVQLEVLASGESLNSSLSTVAAAYQIERDGFDSWKIHFMNLVDEFRRTLDPRLIILSPPSSLDERLRAMLASIVRYVCDEIEISIPSWARKRHYLSTPWFPSGMESLKASAIIESPTAFRNNNIFVHSNFLNRA